MPAAVFVPLALYRLTLRPMWVDEVFSANLADAPLGDAVEEIVERQLNGSVHYLLLNGWNALGGESAGWLRGMSVAAGLVAVLLTYRIGTMLFGRRSGVVAAVVLALMPAFLAQAQNARTGTLTAALACGSVLALLRVPERPSPRRLAAWAAVTVVLCYSHFYGLFVLAAEVLAVVLTATGRDLLRSETRRVALTAGAVGAALAPLGLFILTRDVGQVDWIPALSISRVSAAATDLAGGRTLRVVLAVVVLAAVVQWWRRDDSDRTGLSVLLLWVLVPTAAALTVSLAKPIFISYYLTCVLPALALLVGAVTRRLPTPAITAVVAVFVVGLAAGEPRWYLSEPNENWPAALAFVHERAAGADVVVLGEDYLDGVVAYYGRTSDLDGLSVETGAPLSGRWPRLWVIGRGSPDDDEPFVVEQDGDAIEPAALERFRSVYIARYDLSGDVTFEREATHS